MSMSSDQVHTCYDVPANQYLNLEGKQFSKSSGWYVDAHEAVNQFGSDALRYYLTAISPEASDSSFSWEGFQARVNGELANNIGNLINRCLKFLEEKLAEGMSETEIKAYEHLSEMKKLRAKLAVSKDHLDKKKSNGHLKK